MAILFAVGSSQFLSLGSAVVTTVPYTFACWFRPTTFTTNQSLITCALASNQSQALLSYRGDLANDPIRISYSNNATSGTATTATGISASTWTHACGVFTSATSRDVYINGGGAVNNTTNVTTPTTFTRSRIGQAANLAAGNFADCAMDYVSIWSVAISATEVARIGTDRANPLGVRRQSLVMCLRMLNTTDIIDLVSGAVWSLNASPTDAGRGSPIEPWIRRSYIRIPAGTTYNVTMTLAATSGFTSSGAAVEGGDETFTATSGFSDSAVAVEGASETLAATSGLTSADVASVDVTEVFPATSGLSLSGGAVVSVAQSLPATSGFVTVGVASFATATSFGAASGLSLLGAAVVGGAASLGATSGVSSSGAGAVGAALALGATSGLSSSGAAVLGSSIAFGATSGFVGNFGISFADATLSATAGLSFQVIVIQPSQDLGSVQAASSVSGTLATSSTITGRLTAASSLTGTLQ